MTTNDGYSERTAEFFTFDEIGQELEGVLLAIDDVIIEGRSVKRFTVKTAKSTVAFLGGVQLETMIREDDVLSSIKLEYTGKVTSKGGREVKQFRYWVK